ncbi:n-acetyltransferase domain-containing protein, partial [Trichonephila clavata]
MKIVRHYNYKTLKYFWNTVFRADELLQEGIAHSENKNLIANVDVHQIKPSARRGFGVLETDWKSIEYEIDTPLNPSILSDELPRGIEILPFQSSLLPEIFEYDFSLGGYERRSIIEASCYEENCKTLVAIKDGKCIGFGSIKLDNVEYGRVAPLYADSSVAEAMVKRLITAMPEAKGFAIVTINTNIIA